jgi:hypothetical protein
VVDSIVVTQELGMVEVILDRVVDKVEEVGHLLEVAVVLVDTQVQVVLVVMLVVVVVMDQVELVVEEVVDLVVIPIMV